jgi:hypothetical protein
MIKATPRPFYSLNKDAVPMEWSGCVRKITSNNGDRNRDHPALEGLYTDVDIPAAMMI